MINRVLIIIAVLTCLALETNAQYRINPVDTIVVIKKTLGPLFMYNNQRLTLRTFTDVVKIYPEAHAEIKAAKAHNLVGMFIGVIGGAIIGFQTGSLSSGQEANPTLLIIGAGLVGLTIPLTISSSKHAVKSARIYNSLIKDAGD